ncbi:hypothetical protein [uncultured phage cr36_1]|uniref:Uncharacterized protein n=1 Tax=uncultured phage cr36_1 TaxID=2986397 RepID=A0AAE7RVF8_9CAUD|nr:hypothetical protein M1M47_gp59 [uncultured phage cr36_1]QWM89537.1 hypothetical protein [uncultured phage cr36_1]
MKLDTNPFSYELDESDIRMIRHNCNTKGIPDTIANYLHELDLPNYPYIQTIHFRYKWIMKALLYLGYDKESLEKIHESNLKYEEVNPPIVYEKKKGTNKTSKRITKSSPIKECGFVASSSNGGKSVATPVNSKVRIIVIETNKSMIIDREVAIGLMREQPNKYKIEEV